MMQVALLLCLVPALVAQSNDDPCAPHPDCQSCVSDTGHICGWCSTKVVYQNGLTGANCVSNDGTHPFACYGVFSTEDCLPGWICNNSTHTCEQTAPGSGTTYAECISQCGPSPVPSPPAPMYICNRTINSCVQDEAGTSLNLCLQQCESAPAVPSAPTPVANVYCCNQTQLQCNSCPPGTPGATSKVVCENQCQPKYACDFSSYSCVQSANGTATKDQCDQTCVPLYKCDDTIGQCIQAPYPQPGVPLAECEKNCKPSNNTPSDLAGVWRGLMVQEGFTSGEWDMKFEKGEATLAGPSSSSLSGNVLFVGTPDRKMLSVTVQKSSISGIKVGDVLNMTYAFDGATPENRFVMVASGKPNGAPPATWEAAMTNTGGMTFLMMVCQPTTHCEFNFRSSVNQAARKMKMLSLLDVENVQVDDECMQYSTCASCIAKVGQCGWCSVDVIYADGTTGKHCAGWMSNGTRNQFTCNGIYRTDDCSDYQCTMPQAVCTQVPLGGGMSKAQCEQQCTVAPAAPSLPPPPGQQLMWRCNNTIHQCYESSGGSTLDLCHETCKPPSPAPPSPPMPYAPTYECNVTTLTCYRVQPGHGTSLELCQDLCHATPAAPSPNPNPVFNGTWRGLATDNKYSVGEYNVEFDGDKFTFKLNGKTTDSGTVSSNGAQGGLLFKFDSGKSAGAIYTETNGFTLEKITLVLAGNATVPSGWDLPYVLGGDSGAEYVFVRKDQSSLF